MSKGEKPIVNEEFIPKHNPIGTWLIVKMDKAREVKIGDMVVDTTTGTIAGGLIAIPTETVEYEQRSTEGGQVEVTVHKVGGCAFQREDLSDALEVIKPGTRIVIKRMQGRNIPDEFGNRTLYYHIKEDDVLGVIND